VLDPEIPEDHKIILKESHRVPRHVQARANRLIHQVTRRQEKVYDPRPEDGMCVDISRGGYKSPEYWILKTIMQHLENGQKVMLLASCSYAASCDRGTAAMGNPFSQPVPEIRRLLESTATWTKRVFDESDSVPSWGSPMDTATSSCGPSGLARRAICGREPES
jgi:hypothetical protein